MLRLTHLVIGLLAVALAASAASAQKIDDKNSPAPKRVIRVGYSQCNRGEPWREQMDKDIAANAAKHPEIKVTAKDAQNDALRQIAHVKEFVAAKMDAIIISPKDTSLTQVVAEAFDAGIPVIVLDRKVEGDKYTCFIGADNRVIGAQVGKWVVEELKGKGNVVELKGLSSSTPAAERSEPFRAAIKDTQITVVYDADMEWLGDKAREKMQAALARNPKGTIQLVYGANDPAAIAAYYAAKDAGREKEMMFVGVDALPQEGIEEVRKGILDATFQYPNGADVAIQTVLRIVGREKDIPKTITLGTRLFTKENVEKGGVEIKP